MMNKTVNIHNQKMNLSMVEQHRQNHPVKGRANVDQDKSRIQVCMETSQAERMAGMNISYENSFTAIKKDILKETVDKKKQMAQQLIKETIPIEEKPNKPKDKFIVKNMNTSTNGPSNAYQESSMAIEQHQLNLTQELKPNTNSMAVPH